METWVKQALFGAAVSVGITVGLVLYDQHVAAAAAGSTSSTTAPQTLSLSGNRSFQVTVPSGGTVTSSASASPSIAQASGSTVTAAGIGTTQVTVNWTDSAGTSHQTTIPVTVTA